MPAAEMPPPSPEPSARIPCDPPAMGLCGRYSECHALAMIWPEVMTSVAAAAGVSRGCGEDSRSSPVPVTLSVLDVICCLLGRSGRWTSGRVSRSCSSGAIVRDYRCLESRPTGRLCRHGDMHQTWNLVPDQRHVANHVRQGRQSPWRAIVKDSTLARRGPSAARSAQFRRG